jgi:hypothetical protein
MKNFTLKNTMLAAATAIFMFAAGFETSAQSMQPTLLTYHPEVHRNNTHMQDYGLSLVNYQMFQHALVAGLENRIGQLKAEIRSWSLSPVFNETSNSEAESNAVELEEWMVNPSEWEESEAVEEWMMNPSEWEAVEESSTSDALTLESWMTVPFQPENVDASEESPALENWMVNTDDWNSKEAR